jgi:DNA-binding CsgD family transcriptional regulator
MRPVHLPAGLEDNAVEIYLHKGELRIINNGKTSYFELLPEAVHEAFVLHLMANKIALASLKKDFGLSDAQEMLIQYIKCNFGNFDGIPDMDEDGTIYPECWDCGRRGSCPAEGKVCNRLQGPNGLLTKRETEIFFLLIDGKSHKMIADIFGTHIQTIETQLKDIREKLGCHSSIEVMNFAMKRKLILI